MNAKLLIVALISLVIGGAGVYLLAPTGGSASKTAAETQDEQQLWTCGMHPNIIEEEPGNCPICGMKLVPLKEDKGGSDGKKEILYWRAPMDPNEIYDEPGKSKMGMDLVPVYASDAQQEGIVKIDGVMQQTMNLQTSVAKKRDLQKIITTNGTVKPDERKEYALTTKVSGWVENLYINYTGKEVRKGQKLMEIYSPELVSAQEEVLTALKYKGSVESSRDSEIKDSGNELLQNALRKLRLLDIPESDIQKLLDEGKVKNTLTLYAPFNGIVLTKNVTEGEKIKSGKTLMRIADLRNLWLIADIYEHELPLISEGSPAEITFNYFPGETYEEEVSFIYPTVEQKTRTVNVRFNINNSDLKLKPSMYATVELKGRALENVLSVPEQAIIRGGKDAIAVIALGDGRFKPVEVKLGQFAEGYVQILDGIDEGTEVVTNSQFLIDSESNLKSAASKFKSSKVSKDSVDAEKQMKDTENREHSRDSMQSTGKQEESTQSELVRTGVIDLEKLDKNNDGKVFQDPMDWNVISDEPGRCPLCNMKLKEVSLEDARNNLIEHGYQTKELERHAHQEESIVRKGTIDLKAIDKNNDGKVFQDFMDWNVISDEPGRCPLCNMKLREATLEEAEKNLIENGYKVK